jgi:4-amino-4-deoxy-L-arabinose transferase-like glycosyltransferase
MNSAERTTTLPGTPLGPGQTGGGSASPAAPLRRARVLGRVGPHHLALTMVLALSAVLNVNRLSQNEYANTFYSAGVKSMLRSLHNFVFVSFDPGGLITIDKPPLGLWVQALSAKAFGFTPLSLLLPEAIAGVLAVAALYWVVRPRFGPTAGVASALALAVFPSFVAISRDNNLDAILILMMTLACGVGLRAIETGRLRTLLGCAALVGLAFNTKTLAGCLIVPGLGLGYLVCAPGSAARRVGNLLAAGAVLLVVSASWMALVELTPASQRPFVGGSTNNTEHNLTFDYNGFGRVEGQLGGPGQIPISFRHGSLAHIEKEALRARAQRTHANGVSPTTNGASANGPPAAGGSHGHAGTIAIVPATAPKKAPPPKFLPNGRQVHPTAFGGATGPLRLFDAELGGQGGWMLPFALFGLIALGLWSIGDHSGYEPDTGDAPGAPRATGASTGGVPHAGAVSDSGGGGSSSDDDDGHGRRDPRVAGLIVLGSWFLIEWAVLSLSHGIVHPYYISALGPGTAAMVGGGAVAFVAPGARRSLRLALIPIAVATTVVAQLTLLEQDRYMRWFWPVLIAGAAIGVVALLVLRRWTRPAMALTLGLLLLAPGAYAATTWEFRTDGTFPAAGPHAAASVGPLSLSPIAMRVTRALLDYIDARHPGTRWVVLTEASDTAAPMILLGHDAGAMGGYSGNDPALDGPSLARRVERGEARYVVLGGAYAERGGNAATNAVIAACKVIPAAVWQPRPVNPNALLLYDCAGHERALRAH